MSTLEIILTAISGILTASNFAQFVGIRSLRRKVSSEADIVKTEADKAQDSVLYKRIEFLDARVTKLEQIACFDKDCKLRK